MTCNVCLEGFEPPAFWSVASLQASKFAFSALSAPFAPPFRWFCETISHPLLSTHFLSWVKLWVKASVHPKTILCK